MRANEPKFEADRYFKDRPFYPAGVYCLLEKELGKRAVRIESFLDLACGAGQSFSSYLRHFPHSSRVGFAVDSDSAMLTKAREAYGPEFPNLRFSKGSAEKIPLEDDSVDLAMVASAFHWFEAEKAIPEIARVLRPDGLLFIYEYQFPKCQDSAELHDSVKRRFNLEWKAPKQTPRGSLSDLTAPLRTSHEWKLIGEEKPVWIETLSLEEFLGHLFSQSRYLHAEATQENPAAYRAEITEFFRPFFGAKPLRFDLKPSAVLFKKASRKSTKSP